MIRYTQVRARLRFLSLAVAAAMLVSPSTASAQRACRGTGGRYAFVNGLKMLRAGCFR